MEEIKDIFHDLSNEWHVAAHVATWQSVVDVLILISSCKVRIASRSRVRGRRRSRMVHRDRIPAASGGRRA